MMSYTNYEFCLANGIEIYISRNLETSVTRCTLLVAVM